jgi:hypothetical protein
MPQPAFKTVTHTQGNNQALKDGTVKPKTSISSKCRC